MIIFEEFMYKKWIYNQKQASELFLECLGNSENDGNFWKFMGNSGNSTGL